MSERNLVLFVGAYDDPASAERDFAAVTSLDDASVVVDTAGYRADAKAVDDADKRIVDALLS